MLEHFGEKVRGLRLEKGISREELCGDEAELSVRQLARIELGQSIPSLAKVIFIAKALEVSVGYLTDGANLELPKRYRVKISHFKDSDLYGRSQITGPGVSV